MSNFDPQKVDQLLHDGIAAAKANDKELARTKLKEAVTLEQNNEKAWFWLASVSETDDEKIFCLGNVTVINPGNERAKQMLEALLNKTAEAQEPRGKGSKKRAGDSGSSGALASGAADNRRRMLMIGVLVIAIPVLLVLIVVLFKPGASPEVPTAAALSGSPTQEVAGSGVPNTKEAAVTPSAVPATVVPTEVVERPTLPPTWTPLPTVTSAVGVFATPLASPPPGLKGHLVAKSGIQRTTDDLLPMVVLNPDGSNIRPVQAQNPDRGDFGFLTPDGGRIIFVRYLGGTDSQQMVIMNTNGTQARDLSYIWNNLPPLANHQMATMSRDGKSLVFVAANLPENDGNPGIYYVPMNIGAGGEVGPPVPTDTPTATITRTPKPTVPSTEVATEAVVTEPPPTATTGPTATFVPAKVSRVTAKGTGKNTWPTLSPDGKTVIFAADTTLIGKDGTDLYSLPLTGGTPKPITNDGPAFIESAPSWSPDGKQIAFNASKAGEKFDSIFVMDVNGQNRKVLVQGAVKNSNIRPQWSPDGKFIAFSSDRTGKWEIFIIEVATGTVYQVTSTQGSAYTVCTAWSAS